MSKQHKRWYGRPNRPPENWHTPDKPAIRSVRGWLDDELAPPTPHSTGLVPVTLKVDTWIMILKSLQLYSESHDNEVWQAWRTQIRARILLAVNPHIHQEDTVIAVSLRLEDWRGIWRCTQTVCEARGKDWSLWFDWLSRLMTEQIAGET